MISKEEANQSFKEQTYGCGGQITPPIPWEWHTKTEVKTVTKNDSSAELYASDLKALARLLDYVEKVANQDDVYDVEIRVKVGFPDSQWAVLGYGEAGDPCVLRFEK